MCVLLAYICMHIIMCTSKIPVLKISELKRANLANQEMTDIILWSQKTAALMRVFHVNAVAWETSAADTSAVEKKWPGYSPDSFQQKMPVWHRCQLTWHPQLTTGLGRVCKAWCVDLCACLSLNGRCKCPLKDREVKTAGLLRIFSLRPHPFEGII